MANGKFPGNLPEFSKLDPNQKEFLIEHYKRCEAFWRHWTPTIWSLPSVAAAINIGAYSLIFDLGKDLESHTKVLVLSILVLLNLALTFGFWKHRGMQKTFGKRILDLEKYVAIPTIEFTPAQKKISGSLIYFIVMLIILIISFALFSYEFGSLIEQCYV